MIKRLPLFLFLFTSLSSFAQTTISGKVTDGKNPLPGVSVFLKDTYDGTTTGIDGTYTITTSEKGVQNMVATMIGFNKYEAPITVAGNAMQLSIVLKEQVSDLKAVTISAGSFDASDKKRATVLTPLDIVTTAGSAGDISGALKTLPGTQQIGNQEGLFVRGGEGRETQTFIDGLLVRNPYNSSVPDIAQRGKFSPFLFKGTSFSSGGYSALYGQGMSSALILESKDLAERSESSMSLSDVFVGFGQTQLWEKKKLSMGFNIGYSNLKPYYGLVKQSGITFNHMPDNTNIDYNIRKKIGSHTLLKFYGYANKSGIGISRQDALNNTNNFKLTNHFAYGILTANTLLSGTWSMQNGISYSYNLDKTAIETLLPTGIQVSNVNVHSQADFAQVRTVFTKYIGPLTTLRMGAEFQNEKEKVAASSSSTISYNKTYQYSDQYAATFAEAEIYFNNRLAAKPGLRYEYSSLLGKANWAPRFSLAYKVNNTTQVSFASGTFYQKPDRSYLLYNHALAFEKANHYIVNYQRMANNRILRLEAYYKKYQSLISVPTIPGYPLTYLDTTNAGTGYAQGLELFFRDKKTLKNCDYWISYSYLDTKRHAARYPAEGTANFPSQLQPSYAATHVANIVFKQFFPKYMFGYGITYNYSSGWHYYNPYASTFKADITPDYHAIGMNFNYLTTIKKAFTVFVLGVSNVLGTNPTYGYNYYSPTAQAAIHPIAKRFYFVGCFMSLGVDRRNQNIDDSLK